MPLNGSGNASASARFLLVVVGKLGDGGLKSFGHPIGASGLRMMYEMWLQLRGEAGDRQIDAPKLGVTHNLGGRPGQCVSFVSVVGL